MSTSSKPIVALGLKLAELAKLHVSVGVLGARAAAPHKGADGETTEDAPTVADVATWNHYGTEDIPARPFIALALEAHKPELQKIFARIGRGVVEGKVEPRQALGLMGESVTGAIKQQIADGVPPPNAESTIDRKGSSTPLIDQGQLRGAIAYDVRDGAAVAAQ